MLINRIIISLSIQVLVSETFILAYMYIIELLILITQRIPISKQISHDGSNRAYLEPVSKHTYPNLNLRIHPRLCQWSKNDIPKAEHLHFVSRRLNRKIPMTKKRKKEKKEEKNFDLIWILKKKRYSYKYSLRNIHFLTGGGNSNNKD